MNSKLKVVGNDEDGWNVEVEMGDKTAVFACPCEADADELRDRIDDCSWYQIENRRMV